MNEEEAFEWQLETLADVDLTRAISKVLDEDFPHKKAIKTRTVTLTSGNEEKARYVIYAGINREGKVTMKGAMNLITAERRGELIKRHLARRNRDYGFNKLYNAPEDGNAWDYHHLNKNDCIPVLRSVHQGVRHNGPLNTLEGVLG